MFRSVALGLILAVVAGSCARPGGAEDGVEIEMKVEPQPPAVGTAEIELLFRDASGGRLAARAVELEATMAHAGMVPTFATARQVRPDRWVADLELTMAGDWYVVVDARLADGRAIERTLLLPGVELP